MARDSHKVYPVSGPLSRGRAGRWRRGLLLVVAGLMAALPVPAADKLVRFNGVQVLDTLGGYHIASQSWLPCQARKCLGEYGDEDASAFDEWHAGNYQGWDWRFMVTWEAAKSLNNYRKPKLIPEDMVAKYLPPVMETLIDNLHAVAGKSIPAATLEIRLVAFDESVEHLEANFDRTRVPLKYYFQLPDPNRVRDLKHYLAHTFEGIGQIVSHEYSHVLFGLDREKYAVTNSTLVNEAMAEIVGTCGHYAVYRVMVERLNIREDFAFLYPEQESDLLSPPYRHPSVAELQAASREIYAQPRPGHSGYVLGKLNLAHYLGRGTIPRKGGKRLGQHLLAFCSSLMAAPADLATAFYQPVNPATRGQR